MVLFVRASAHTGRVDQNSSDHQIIQSILARVGLNHSSRGQRSAAEMVERIRRVSQNLKALMMFLGGALV